MGSLTGSGSGWSIRIMNWKKAKTLFYRSDSTSHIPFLKKVCNFFIKSLWCTPFSQTYFKTCVNFFSCSTNIWIHLFIRLSTYRYLDFISEKKKQFFGRNIFLANNFSDIRHHARYCRIQLQYFFSRWAESQVGYLEPPCGKVEIFRVFPYIAGSNFNIFFQTSPLVGNLYNWYTYIYISNNIRYTYLSYIFQNDTQDALPYSASSSLFGPASAMDTRYIQ